MAGTTHNASSSAMSGSTGNFEHSVVSRSIDQMVIVGAVTTLVFSFVLLSLILVSGQRDDVTESAPDVPKPQSPQSPQSPQTPQSSPSRPPSQSSTHSDSTADSQITTAGVTTAVVDTSTDFPVGQDSKIYAGLTCITSERASGDDVNNALLYEPCDNVIYSVGTRCSIASDEKELVVIAGLADKGRFIGFNYDGSVDMSCYENLGRVQGWEDNGYAALGVLLANDFSDVDQVAVRLKSTFDTIEATGRTQTPKIVGIKINPTDADITKENADKLAQMLLVSSVSMVIFESHIGINGVPCKIAVTDVLISKNNVIKLTEDIDMPIAISSTAGLLLITTDGQHKERGSSCNGSRVVSRSGPRCDLLRGTARDGHSVITSLGVVIEYLVTDSAKYLLADSSVKHRTKYGVAIFDLQHYDLNKYVNCPLLDLGAFKLPRPASTG